MNTQNNTVTDPQEGSYIFAAVNTVCEAIALGKLTKDQLDQIEDAFEEAEIADLSEEDLAPCSPVQHLELARAFGLEPNPAELDAAESWEHAQDFDAIEGVEQLTNDDW